MHSNSRSSRRARSRKSSPNATSEHWVHDLLRLRNLSLNPSGQRTRKTSWSPTRAGKPEAGTGFPQGTTWSARNKWQDRFISGIERSWIHAIRTSHLDGTSSALLRQYRAQCGWHDAKETSKGHTGQGSTTTLPAPCEVVPRAE